MNLAYAAGFVDGEGCIAFTRVRSSIYPRVSVTNTNLEILQELQAKWGGDIQPLSLRRPGWKQGYSWRISWSKAVAFLDQLSPYLRVKARQAHAVFAWDAIRPGSGRERTAENAEAIDLLVAQMHWLNAKGDQRGVEPIEEAL